jgi:hypothetical protein
MGAVSRALKARFKVAEGMREDWSAPTPHPEAGARTVPSPTNQNRLPNPPSTVPATTNPFPFALFAFFAVKIHLLIAQNAVPGNCIWRAKGAFHTSLGQRPISANLFRDILGNESRVGGACVVVLLSAGKCMASLP